MTAAADPNDPLGFDMKVGEDLDASGRSAAGVELVEDAMLHRLSCGRLLQTGAPDDQVDFGEDVQAWIGEAITDDELQARAPLLEEVLRRDQRIADTTVTVTNTTPAGSGALQSFTIAVQATLITGQTLSRIIGIDAVTVDFLAGGT